MPGHIQPHMINQRAAKLRAIAALKHELFLERVVGKTLRALGQQYDASTGIVRGLSREYIQAEFPGTPTDLNVEHTVKVIAIRDGRALCRREEI